MKQLLILLIMSLFISCKPSADVVKFVDSLPELSLPFKTYEYFSIDSEPISLNSAENRAIAALFATAEEKLGKYEDDFSLVRIARLKTTGHGKLLVATTIDSNGPGGQDIYLLVLDEEYSITDVKNIRFYNEYCTPNNSLTKETEISETGEIVVMEYLDKLHIGKSTYTISDKHTIEEVKKPGTTAKSYEIFNIDVCITHDFVWDKATMVIEPVSTVHAYKFDFDVNQWLEVPLYIGQLYKEIFFEYGDMALSVEGGGGDYPVICKRFDKTMADGLKIGVWTVKSGYDYEKSEQEAYSTHELIAYVAKDDKICMLERTSSLPQRADDYQEDALPDKTDKMLIRGNLNEITLSFSPNKGITVDSLVLFNKDFDENDNMTAEQVGILGKKMLADRHLNDLNQDFLDSIIINYQPRQNLNSTSDLKAQIAVYHKNLSARQLPFSFRVDSGRIGSPLPAELYPFLTTSYGMEQSSNIYVLPLSNAEPLPWELMLVDCYDSELRSFYLYMLDDDKNIWDRLEWKTPSTLKAGYYTVDIDKISNGRLTISIVPHNVANPQDATERVYKILSNGVMHQEK